MSSSRDLPHRLTGARITSRGACCQAGCACVAAIHSTTAIAASAEGKMRYRVSTSCSFWIASTDAQAAYHTVSGSVTGIADAAMVTDGITRLVEWYGYDWPKIFTVLDIGGPNALIASVRAAEQESPPSYGKVHDDATAVYANVLPRIGGTPRQWRHHVFANS